MDYLLPDRMILTDLSAITELTVREKEDTYIVHLLNYVIQKKSKRLDLIEEKYYASGKTLRIRTGNRPERVMLQPEGTALEFSYENGYTCVKLPTVSGHTMIEIVKG